MSVRGEQFWLDPTRAAQLRPRSRPRYTLTPSIVLRDGQPFMAIGTPGGDNQDQTILQAFLNVVEFWNDWYPNLHEAFKELQARGHNASRVRAQSISSCATAVLIDPATGNRIAGADPRRDCYAMAY